MLRIRDLGLMPYETAWQEMKHFTSTRSPDTPDELWLLEHPAIYTQGQAGKAMHIIDAKNIPVVQSDRGGQVTYHGPGQLIGYILMDLRPRHMGIRTLVNQLEQIIITTLGNYQIQGKTRFKAPGVYVNEQKIASIGLRVRNYCTYHGIALNVAMDLEPFNNINPCGFDNIKVTQMQNFDSSITLNDVKKQFAQDFLNILNYNFTKK